MTEASPASYWKTDSLRLRPVSDLEDRVRVVDDTFDHPHFNTREDVEFIAEEFGLSEDDARRSFIEADFLFAVETHAGAPVYLICVTPNGIAQTAMTDLLESEVKGLTRLLRKLAKSPVAEAVFKGTRTGCDVGDWRARWIEFLGFEKTGTHTLSDGDEMIVFEHKGRG